MYTLELAIFIYEYIINKNINFIKYLRNICISSGHFLIDLLRVLEF